MLCGHLLPGAGMGCLAPGFCCEVQLGNVPSPLPVPHPPRQLSGSTMPWLFVLFCF